MSPEVARGPVSAFGCRVAPAHSPAAAADAGGDGGDGDGDAPTYTPLHGKVDFAAGRAELSSTDGKQVYEGDIIVVCDPDGTTPKVCATCVQRLSLVGRLSNFLVPLALL